MLSASMALTVAVSIVLIWSARATPRVGRPTRSGQCAGSQIRERISDLPQWKKTCFGVTLRTARAGLPFTEERSRNTLSVRSRAVPLTRREYSWPGIRKSIPTFGLTMRLLKLSTRLLPGRSGTSKVCGSSKETKPGASPRGEASGQPSASAVDNTRNGERAINAPAWASM
jgi:hypothetical protein